MSNQQKAKTITVLPRGSQQPQQTIEQMTKKFQVEVGELKKELVRERKPASECLAEMLKYCQEHNDPLVSGNIGGNNPFVENKKICGLW